MWAGMKNTYMNLSKCFYSSNFVQGRGAGPDADVPGIFQALAAVSEFGGGLAWMLGALMPLFSLGISCTMAVAIYMHIIVRGDPFVGSNGSFEPERHFCSV